MLRASAFRSLNLRITSSKLVRFASVLTFRYNSCSMKVEKSREYSNAGGILNTAHKVAPPHLTTSVDIHRWGFLKFVAGVDPLITPVQTRVEGYYFLENGNMRPLKLREIKNLRSNIELLTQQQTSDFNEAYDIYRNYVESGKLRMGSLDMQVGDDRDATLAQFISDSDGSEGLDSAIQDELHTQLREIMSQILTKREIEVLHERYKRGLTQRQTEKSLGIGRFVVYEAERVAVEKLRAYFEEHSEIGNDIKDSITGM